MSEIVARREGAVAISSFGPSANPADFGYQPAEWLAHSINDMNRDLLLTFQEKNLFPGDIYTDYVGSLETKTPSKDLPAREVTAGWIAGSLGYTRYELWRPLSRTHQPWEVSGEFTAFSKPPMAKALTIDPNPGDQVVEGGEDYAKTVMARLPAGLEAAAGFPNTVLSKLAAVIAPIQVQSNAMRCGEGWTKFGYSLHAFVANAHEFVAATGEHFIDCVPNEQVQSLEERLATAPWSVKLVRGLFE